MNQPDLFTIKEDTSHVVVLASYHGREYPVPVPAELRGLETALQSYCRGYLKAARVIPWGEVPQAQEVAQ